MDKPTFDDPVLERIFNDEVRYMEERTKILMECLVKREFRIEAVSELAIRTLRETIMLSIARMPALKPIMQRPDWLLFKWGSAMIEFEDLNLPLPERCPWTLSKILNG